MTATAPAPASGTGPLPGAGVPAARLQVAGLVPLSTVDWPGHLVATVFCQGCPWNCGYCQNPSLIDCAPAGRVSWAEEVEPLLLRRRGLLDGVVFTGGEATRQAALPSAMARVRDLGFSVGLHTGGAYPRRLAEMLPLVDWVGLDIKALPGDYATVTGVPAAGRRAWESLAVVLAAGTDLEVRLTVHPGAPQAGSAVEIARRLRAAGVRTFALQDARLDGTRPQFRELAAGWDRAAWHRELAALTSEIAGMGFPSFVVR